MVAAVSACDAELRALDLVAARAALVTLRLGLFATTSAGTSLTLCLMPDQLHLFDSQGMACHRTVALPN